MSKRTSVLWTVATGIAVLSLWYVFLFEPAMNRSDRAVAEKKKLDAQLEKAEANSAKRPQFEAAIQDVKLRLSTRTAQDVTAGLVKFLESLKVRTGTSVSYKSLNDRQVGEIFKELPLEMEAECALSALVQILHDLGYWEEYFKISRISLASAEKGRVHFSIGGSILGVINPIRGVNPKTLKKVAIAPPRPQISEFEGMTKTAFFGEGAPIIQNPPAAVKTVGRGTLFLRGIYKSAAGEFKALLEDAEGAESKSVKLGNSVGGFRVDLIDKDRISLSRGPEIVKMKLGDFLVVDRESK